MSRDLLVGERNIEARAENPQLVFVELFLLVRDVLAFARFAEAVALDRARENHRRLALVFRGRLVRGVHFTRIVAAEAQTPQLFVTHRFDQLQQPRIGAEEMFAHVRAGFDDEFLVFAVHQFAHALHQQAFGVAIENRVPLACPTEL